MSPVPPHTCHSCREEPPADIIRWIVAGGGTASQPMGGELARARYMYVHVYYIHTHQRASRVYMLPAPAPAWYVPDILVAEVALKFNIFSRLAHTPPSFSLFLVSHTAQRALAPGQHFFTVRNPASGKSRLSACSLLSHATFRSSPIARSLTHTHTHTYTGSCLFLPLCRILPCAIIFEISWEWSARPIPGHPAFVAEILTARKKCANWWRNRSWKRAARLPKSSRY